jgi:hypothetical protein
LRGQVVRQALVEHLGLVWVAWRRRGYRGQARPGRWAWRGSRPVLQVGGDVRHICWNGVVGLLPRGVPAVAVGVLARVRVPSPCGQQHAAAPLLVV